MNRNGTTFIKKKLKRFKQEAKKRVLMGVLFLFLLGGMIGGGYLLGYAIVRSPVFLVRRVEVEGIEKTRPVDIIRRLGLVQPVNIFQLDLERVRERVESLPWVKDAIIIVKLPDTLHIKIKEKRPAAVAILGKRSYLVDESGSIIVRTGEKVSSLPSLNIVSSGFVKDGRIVPRVWRIFLKLEDALKREMGAEKISRVEVGRDGFRVFIGQVVAKIGWKDVDVRVERLKKILKHARKHHIDVAQIDLTYESDAVVKLSEKNMGGIK